MTGTMSSDAGFTRMVTKLKAGKAVLIESASLAEARLLRDELRTAVEPRTLRSAVIYARDTEDRVVLEHELAHR